MLWDKLVFHCRHQQHDEDFTGVGGLVRLCVCVFSLSQ